MVQNLWDAAKVVLRKKFIAIQSTSRSKKKSQINNLTLHLKELKNNNKQNPNQQIKGNNKN